MRIRYAKFFAIAAMISGATVSACSGDPYPAQAKGGAPGMSGGSTSGGAGPGTGGAATGGAATGGASTGGTAATATFAQVKAILDTNCAVVGCHAGSQPPDLRSSNPSLYMVLTTTAVMECGNDMIVKPSDTENSAMLGVLTGKCGTLKMPVGCSTNMCLPAAEIATITSWIQSGAPQ